MNEDQAITPEVVTEEERIESLFLDAFQRIESSLEEMPSIVLTAEGEKEMKRLAKKMGRSYPYRPPEMI